MASARSIILNIIGNDRASRTFREVGDEAERAAASVDDLNEKASKGGPPKAINALNASLRGTSKSVLIGTKAVAGLGVASSAAFAGIGAGAAGAALAIAGIGIKLASANAGVKSAFADMKADITKQAQSLATPFVAPLKQVATIISQTFAAIGPQLKAAFATLAPTIVPLVTGISQAVKNLSVVFQPLAQVGAKILGGLGPALAGLGKQLVAFLTPILNVLNQVGSGLFQTLIGGIGNVLVSLSPLLATLVQVGSTLLGPLLGAINTVVGALGAALRPVLQAIAPVFRQLVGAVAPLVAQLVGGLSPILVSLAPILSSVFSILQPVISALISGLQPVIAALVPVIGLLIGALGRILAALTPLLVPLGQLITGLLNGLMPVLTPIITLISQTASVIIGALVQALIQCMPALQQIVLAIASLLPALTPLVGIWKQWLLAIIPILPPLVQLVAVIVTALAPVLRLLITVMVKIETTIAGLVIPVFRLMVSVVTWLVGVLTPAIAGIVVAFRSIGAVATWLWNVAIGPAFRAIGAIATWLWQSVIVPAFNAIKTALAAAWAFMQPVFNTIAGVIRTVVGIAFIFLSNLVKAAWIAIQIAVKVAWALIQPIFSAISTVLRKVVGPAFQWLRSSVITPVWNGIKAAISAAWTFIRPIWNSIRAFLTSTLGPAFRTFKSIASTAWSGLRSAISTASNGIKTIFNGLKSALNTVKSAFSTAVAGIKKIWDGLKSVAKTPVNFVIGVYNRGIVDLVNRLAGFAGVKTRLTPIPQLARGGTLDNPMPVGPMKTNGPLAIVGEGRPQWPEYVIPTDPKFRSRAQGLWAAAGRDLGGSPGKWLTGSQQLGGEGLAFARGGVLPVQTLAFGGIIGDFVKGIKNFTIGNVEKAAGSVLNKVLGGSVPGSGVFRDMVAAVPKWIKDTVLGWIKKKVSSGDGLIGGGGFAKALAWAKSQAGKPYVWGGVGPGGYDCSGFMSAITNVIHGRSPYSRLFSTRSFGASGGPGGFVRNANSAFRVGVTNAGVGHMAGTLNGVNVESSGSRGVHYGPGARGANDGLFGYRYGLKLARGGVLRTATYDSGGLLQPGYTLAYNGTGKAEVVAKLAGGGKVGSHQDTRTIDPAARLKAGVDLLKQITSAMESSVSKISSFFASLNAQIRKFYSGATERSMLAWSASIQKAMSAAATKAADIASKISAAKDYAASVTSSAKDYANLSSLGSTGSAAGIATGLAGRATSLQKFAGQLTQLKARGLNSSLLSQIIGMGAGQGSALAATLLAGDSETLKAINGAQGQIDTLAGKLGQTAANVMYDSGKNAGKGFLSGLYGQQAALNKLMDQLGRRLAGGVHKGFGVPSAPSAYQDVQSAKFDSGGMLMPGWTLAYNATGRPEPVFTSVEAAADFGPGRSAREVHLHLDKVIVQEKADVDMLLQQIEFRLRAATL